MQPVSKECIAPPEHTEGHNKMALHPFHDIFSKSVILSIISLEEQISFSSPQHSNEAYKINLEHALVHPH